MYKLGDIVSFSLPEGGSGQGWIVYKSKRYRNVIGVVFFDPRQQLAEAVETAEAEAFILPVVYTTVLAAKGYDWEVVGNRQVDDAAKMLTRRIVAGVVQVCDDVIGPATNEDYKELPVMEVVGMPAIFDLFKRYTT